MKNKEKYHDKILAIALTGDHLAIVNGKPVACTECTCSQCDLHSACNRALDGDMNDSISRKVQEWAEAEADVQPIRASSVDDAFHKIWDSYRNTEDKDGAVRLSMTEVLRSVELQGLSLEDAAQVYYMLRKYSGTIPTFEGLKIQ